MTEHYMLTEILEQPKIIAATLDKEQSNLREIADELNKRRLRRLYIVGCGDMLFAAVAAKYMFTKLAKIQAEPAESMEFSHYFSASLDKKSAVLVLSVSGRTPRTVEAGRVAKRRGMYVIAMTDNPGSPLTKTSHRVIHMHTAPARELAKTRLKVPYVGYHHMVPQTKTYTTSLALLFSLAIHLAQSLHVSVTIADQLKDLNRTVNLIRKTTELHNEKMNFLAEKYSSKDRYFFVGAGPNYGTAVYGSAKLMEFGVLGIAQQMEEYCHVQFFATEPSDPVFFISPSGLSHGRLMEILPEMRRVKLETVVLADEKDEDLRKVAQEFIGMPDGVDEALTPLYYCVPLQLFAYHLAVKKGLDPNRFRGGMNTDEYQEATYQMIRRSKLKV